MTGKRIKSVFMITILLLIGLMPVTGCMSGKGNVNGNAHEQSAATGNGNPLTGEPAVDYGNIRTGGRTGAEMNSGTGNNPIEANTTAAGNNNATVNSTAIGENTADGTGTADEACTPGTAADRISERLARMSIDEKIGQMLIVGFKGEKAGEDIRSMVQKYHVGGIILFGGNIDSPLQLVALVNEIKGFNSKNSVPLFISVDEEGGRISRMPDQLHEIPSNEEIGKINDEILSYNIGGLLAHELKSFGFNMDFAPVLDIFSNSRNTVIGDRAFGSDAETVSRLGVQTMNGIQAGGVIPVVKHFPGHGDTSVDSHIGLPTVDYDMDRLKGFELMPFQAAIENQADAVMIAHILMKKIDPENPASLSKAVITDLLRNKMGFGGVVVTDDMTMGAITGNYETENAVVKSINAGSDIILVCHGYDNQMNAFAAIKTAVKNGTITEKRLDESVCRILKLKEKYGLSDKRINFADIDEINKKIDDILGK